MILFETLQALAPLRLAADWDNVGLLVEPAGIGTPKTVHLAIDLTEAVLAEALEEGTDGIVAYHPPIFRGEKRITQQTPLGRMLDRLLRAGVWVYSPHTALDAAVDGMADWLLDGAGAMAERAPIEPALDQAGGFGRRGVLAGAMRLPAMIDALKEHLGLDHVRVAGPPEHLGGLVPIRTVAVCPGAGGSVLERVQADLLITGEMRHHDVLARAATDTSVILTDHTNTERGYLPILAERLAEAHPDIAFRVCRSDRDPLEVW